MACDRTRRSDAGEALVARARNVFECPPQVTQTMWLTHQVCMQCNAHHQRLTRGLPQHFLEVIDHHIGERLRIHLACKDHRDIVDFFRIRNRPQRLTVARVQARGLIVVAPVERVLIARFGYQIAGDMTFREPRRQPACWLLSALRRNPLPACSDQRAFVVFGKRSLPFRIRMTMRDQFIAALSESGDQLRAVIVERRVDDGGGGQREFIEEIETALCVYT